MQRERRLGGRSAAGCVRPNSSSASSAPPANAAADQPKAVVKPWTAAAAAPWALPRWAVVAPAAIVESSAVPIEPPICWLVLTAAEATPASPRSTPSVALLKADRSPTG